LKLFHLGLIHVGLHPRLLFQRRPPSAGFHQRAAETARYLELPLGLVQAAISYYGAYRDEIDRWIQANEQQLAQAHAAWSSGQDAVRQ